MLQILVCLRDGSRVQTVKQTLQDAATGRKVSKKRLKAAQDFLLELLEEVNAKRPTAPIKCGGRVV